MQDLAKAFMPRFVCLWWPDFAAWAMQRSDPNLAERAVLIHQRGSIVAASLEARQAGVQTGWTLYRAQAQLQLLVPDAAFLALHGPTVHSAWNDVLLDLLALTPCLESWQPGLLLADVRPSGLVVPLLRVWQGQNASVRGAVRGGVADDRSTAELAAFTASPGTLRSVRSGQSAAFLKGVPLTSLTSLSTGLPVAQSIGLREDTVQRLGWFGWHRVGDLSHLSKRQLKAQFDQGELLFRYAQADDKRPVSFYREPPVSSATFTFEQAVREPCEWESVLCLLIEQCLTKLQDGPLGHSGQGAQNITIVVDSISGVRRASRLLHSLTNDRRVFLELAQRMMREELVGVSFMQLSVQLRELQALPVEQGSLFGARRASPRVAIQAMQERFPGVLQRIVMLDKNAYLPETAFRFEPMTMDDGSAKKTIHSKRRAAQMTARTTGRKTKALPRKALPRKALSERRDDEID